MVYRNLIRDSLYTYHGHYSAAKIYHNYYVFLSIISGIFSVTVTFLLLTQIVDIKTIIVYAFIASIATVVNSALQLDVKSTVHKNAGDDMLNLYKDIVDSSLLLDMKDSREPPKIGNTVMIFRSRMNTINSKSPMIPRIAFKVATKQVLETPSAEEITDNGIVSAKRKNRKLNNKKN
jgi:hypothetical protein